MHSKILASSQQQSPVLCSIKSTPSHFQSWKKQFYKVYRKKRDILSHVLTHIHKITWVEKRRHTCVCKYVCMSYMNMSQWCSSHLLDPQSTPPQSLLPDASVSSFPLSSPSPAAYELWPTKKQETVNVSYQKNICVKEIVTNMSLCSELQLYFLLLSVSRVLNMWGEMSAFFIWSTRATAPSGLSQKWSVAAEIFWQFNKSQSTPKYVAW